MAIESASQPAPSAQVVGNAFVEQYYQILHKSPEAVHRFYQDSSVISRPELDGIVTTVTSMKGINDKICSFDYKKYKAEIKTADAQVSHNDGVIVLVTGSLTGPDNIRKIFTQTFFLAPQDKGYFVLNDMFRYVEDSLEPLENGKVTVNGAHDSTPTPEPETTQGVPPPTVNSSTSPVKEVKNAEQRVQDLANERVLVNEKDVVVAPSPQSNKSQISEIAELAPPVAQDDTPKKTLTYASILSSQAKKGDVGATKAYAPPKVAPAKIECKTAAPKAQPKVSAPNASGSASVGEGRKEDEAEGHSVYVQNLPFSVTASEVEMEFKKFGLIKQGGVQVRNNKLHDSCFGFVEFHSLSSMNDAIKASPVTIGGRKAVVEIKRTTTRVGSGGSRFPIGRGGFRRDNFRGRTFVNGQGYARNEFTDRGDFSGRGRGPGARGGQVYQQGRGRGGQVYQQGRGRGGRQGGTYRIADHST